MRPITVLGARRARARSGRADPLANPAWVDEVVEAHARVPDDAAGLRLAIDLSRENILLGTGGPFGAVVVDESSATLIAAGVNGVERLGSSLAHAEMAALAAAEHRLGTYSLAAVPERCVLYSSCEPCAMCLGAILWSGVPRVVYAARREDAEAIGFDEGPVFPASVAYLRDRGIVIEPGPLREEAAAVLRVYVERGGLVYNGA